MLSVNEIVTKYLGVEYQFKGREDALDCYGFVIAVFRDVGVTLPDIKVAADEKWHLHGHTLDLEELQKIFKRVDQPKVFDLAVYHNPLGVVHHAGVCIGEGRFIHATKKTGVCIHHLTDQQWQSRLVGIYRHKDLT